MDEENTEWSEYYSDATAASLLETSELKDTLPIAYVLDAADITVTAQADGKLVASCPFHDDNNPSFDVYGENLERWGCKPCGLDDDVFGLIAKLYSLPNFLAAKAKAVELLTEMWTSEWEGPTKSERKVLDTDFVRQVAEGISDDDLSLVGQLLTIKKAAYTPQWLYDTFGVGVYGTAIVIPYRSADGTLLTFKHRTPTTKPHALAGSTFNDLLYGEWMDDSTKDVVLAEGESDVWAGTFADPQYIWLGLPTGAGKREGLSHAQVKRLAGRRVILASDGDKTGREFVRKAHPLLVFADCAVTVAPMPDGADVSTLSDIAGTIAMARAIPEHPQNIQATAQGYVRPARKEDDLPGQISNWTLVPKRELMGETGAGYEGILMPSGKPAVLSTIDLASKGKMIQWSASHGGAWYGSDRDAQLLLGLLQAEAPYLPVGKMATVAGLHDGHMIWPGGKIGPDHWQYVAPKTDVHLEQKINIGPDKWEPSHYVVLRNLHEHRVMDPILAWLAAAPVRSLLREFPILAVTGPAGTGKTTLLETIIPAFSGASIFNTITNTTKHSLFSHVSSTNAFPQWWDEYRPGARKDTLEAMRQILRDAYTMQKSSRGGLGDHWAEVTAEPATGPIIISGEDAFHEVSHTERMVMLNLPLKGKSAEALKIVRSWGTTGGPFAYLSWIHEGLRSDAGWFPTIENYSTGPATLPNRQRLNMGVLELGWNLLTSFLEPFGINLGDPDFSLVLSEAEEAQHHAPIEDALKWALEEPEAMFFICSQAHEGETYLFVRTQNFIKFVNDRSEFILPGGETAIRKYLQAKYDAHMGRVTHGGSTKYMLGMKLDLLQ